MAFHILICNRWQSSLWSTAVVWPMSGHVFPPKAYAKVQLHQQLCTATLGV